MALHFYGQVTTGLLRWEEVLPSNSFWHPENRMLVGGNPSLSRMPELHGKY